MLKQRLFQAAVLATSLLFFFEKTVAQSPVELPIAAFTGNPTTGCAPLTVTYTNQSQFATSYQWVFQGGTPGTSTLTNPTVVYSTPGTYSVTLTAISAAGQDVLVKTNYISVLTTPTANFTFTSSGLTATFTSTSTGNPTSYLWNFGDGQTSTEQDPIHTYAQDGVYSVKLTVTNQCGTTMITKTVTIVTLPTANFTFTPATGCAPLTVHYTNTSSANSVSYMWAFLGGSPATSTAVNPTVIYTQPGTYSVTMTATNTAGSDTKTVVNAVTVGTVPATSFASTASGLTVSFTNTTTGATSYSWNFGDGQTSTEQNPSHTYAADGTYTVVLTATNACGSTTFTKTFTLTTPPTAAFTAAPTSGCATLTVAFTNNSSANSTSFLWDFPGGSPSTSTEQNPTVTYQTAGTYTATLTATNDGDFYQHLDERGGRHLPLGLRRRGDIDARKPGAHLLG